MPEPIDPASWTGPRGGRGESVFLLICAGFLAAVLGLIFLTDIQVPPWLSAALFTINLINVVVGLARFAFRRLSKAK